VGATASSRGSMSETAWLRCETNEMLLAIVVKHGARRIARQSALAVCVLRSFGGALIPGRSREMRLVSRRRLGLRWSALRASFRHGTQWPASVRQPSAGL
jgi:hypothetical protein